MPPEHKGVQHPRCALACLEDVRFAPGAQGSAASSWHVRASAPTCWSAALLCPDMPHLSHHFFLNSPVRIAVHISGWTAAGVFNHFASPCCSIFVVRPPLVSFHIFGLPPTVVDSHAAAAVVAAAAAVSLFVGVLCARSFTHTRCRRLPTPGQIPRQQLLTRELTRSLAAPWAARDNSFRSSLWRAVFHNFSRAEIAVGRVRRPHPHLMQCFPHGVVYHPLCPGRQRRHCGRGFSGCSGSHRPSRWIIDPWAQMSWPALAESSSLHPERGLFPSYPLRWVAGFPVYRGPLVSDGHVGPHPLEEAFGDDVEHAVVSFVDIPDKLYDPG